MIEYAKISYDKLINAFIEDLEITTFSLVF